MTGPTLSSGRRSWVWAVQRANAAAPGRSRVDKVAQLLEEQRQSAESSAPGGGVISRLQVPWPELAVMAVYVVALGWHLLG